MARARGREGDHGTRADALLELLILGIVGGARGDEGLDIANAVRAVLLVSGSARRWGASGRSSRGLVKELEEGVTDIDGAAAQRAQAVLGELRTFVEDFARGQELFPKLVGEVRAGLAQIEPILPRILDPSSTVVAGEFVLEGNACRPVRASAARGSQRAVGGVGLQQLPNVFFVFGREGDESAVARRGARGTDEPVRGNALVVARRGRVAHLVEDVDEVVLWVSRLLHLAYGDREVDAVSKPILVQSGLRFRVDGLVDGKVRQVAGFTFYVAVHRAAQTAHALNS